MSSYFMQFQVRGEVAGILRLEEPEQRLLIDISTEIADASLPYGRPYLSFTCFTIFDPASIELFLKQFEAGDQIEATGSFAQSNYVPHKTSYIDTTFELLSFRKVRPEHELLKVDGTVFEPALDAPIH